MNTETSYFRKTQIFICVLIISAFTTCKFLAECFPEFTGRVLSNSNKTPIEGATVELINQSIKVKTDKDGFFKISTSGCFDAHFRISKEHYKPFEITFRSSSNSNSYEIKSESKSVDYDEPFFPDTNNKNTFITGTWITQNSESFSVSSGALTYYLDTLKNITEEINDIQMDIRSRTILNE